MRHYETRSERRNLRTLHTIICFSAVSSVDSGIGRRTSPRRTSGDAGGTRLAETGTVQQQLSG